VREIRMLRSRRRGLETGPRTSLNGHEGGNPGYGQGISYGPPRQPPTLRASSRRLAHPAGVSPARARVRSPVAESQTGGKPSDLKPTDKAIFRMVSKSPGRNASEPIGGLDRKRSGGRVFYSETKAARIDES